MNMSKLEQVFLAGFLFGFGTASMLVVAQRAIRRIDHYLHLDKP